jgi:hypothetical protein
MATGGTMADDAAAADVDGAGVGAGDWRAEVD